MAVIWSSSRYLTRSRVDSTRSPCGLRMSAFARVAVVPGRAAYDAIADRGGETNETDALESGSRLNA